MLFVFFAFTGFLGSIFYKGKLIAEFNYEYLALDLGDKGFDRCWFLKSDQNKEFGLDLQYNLEIYKVLSSKLFFWILKAVFFEDKSRILLKHSVLACKAIKTLWFMFLIC